MPPWVEDLPERPTVYATLGTALTDAHGVFETIFDALSGEDINVIATFGRTDPTLLGPLPDNVRIERYIPQTLILPLCDAVIVHGGYGSVMKAIRRGLPLVVVPMVALDNRLNADRVASLGAGVTIHPEERSSAAIIRDAVRAVLTEPSYREAARSVAVSVTTLPPLEEAARLIEQLSTTRRPVPAIPPDSA